KSRERLEESVAIQLRVNKKSGLYRAASTNSDSLRTTFVTPTPGQHNYPKLQQQEHTQSSVMGRSADDATGITNQGRAHRNTAVHHEADAPYNDEAISSLHPKERRAIREKRNRDLATRQSRLKALKEQELELSAAERELDAQRQRISESWGHQRNSAGVRFKLRERKK
ncbi:MAG: hypothetical protein MMC23_009963, partial [Stictis urceolatum]|nr:hypothetical protein [Stictis urceolata]